MRLSLLSLILAVFLTVPAITGQDNFEFWSDADYDPDIPTIDQVLGYEPGEHITRHRDIIRYFEALAAAAPDRMFVGPYATSWEGRQLVYVVVSSPENLARIDEIKAGMKRLRDPRLTPRAQAEKIIGSQPAITWLSYGVHGNEISPSEASMLTAYHLLASRGDKRVADILHNSIVVIDPVQNPDGHDRFVHQFEMSRGLIPDTDRISAEHDEPWPGGRTNHYLFDLNRDWFVLTQPETKGRIDLLQQWYPLVFVDAHEMGSDETYFFSPEAAPYNPHLTEVQRKNLTLFGQANAHWFDKLGIDYFTREVYDAFYPGYGASWPSYFGSIAMTYEQASARGLRIRQSDGNDLSLREGIRNHFITSLATAETVAANREKLLTEFYDYQVSAIEEGTRGDVRAYIVPAQADQAAADKLAGLLTQQGVEVGVAASSFKACGRTYQAGSYVINLAQPAKRLIRTLLDADVPMEKEFIAEQERRRAKKLPNEIYDVTAWSLPLMMNLRVEKCSDSVSGDFSSAAPELIRPGTVSGSEGAVAYLIPWGTAPAVHFLVKALRRDLNVKSADKAFTLQDRQYPSGTLILETFDNPKDLADIIEDLAAVTGADAVAVDTSWVTDGPNFGSGKVVPFNKLKVAVAWDLPTAPPSAGNTRFVIEQQFDLPVTPIRTSTLARSDLRRYQVVILPETLRRMNYSDILGKPGLENLRNWVNKGGVLIGLGNAVRFLSDPDVDLISLRREDAVVEGKPEAPEAKSNKDSSNEDKRKTVPGRYLTSDLEYQASVVPKRQDPDIVPGVLLNAEVDTEHWLGAGAASTIKVLAGGPDIYTPIRMDKGVNVARFSSADDLRVSGYLWKENRKQLAYKPFVAVQPSGKGFVIAFTQDPNFRACLDGLNVLFMNAVFRAAAHAHPVR